MIFSRVMVAGTRSWLVKVGVVVVALCGGVSNAGADPAPQAASFETAAYVDPPPVRVYRFHVYSTMKSRWKKTVMIDSLVSTSQGGVVEGDQGLLERKLESAGGAPSEWALVAKVTVKKLLPKGRLQVEIESEEPEAKTKRNGKLPFAPGQKVRLQIDRVLSAAG